jgi:hypothetical protein
MSFNAPLRNAATGEFPTRATLDHLATNPRGSRLLGRVLAAQIQRQIAAGQFTGGAITPTLNQPTPTVNSPSNQVAGKKSTSAGQPKRKQRGTLVGSSRPVGSGKKTLLGA